MRLVLLVFVVCGPLVACQTARENERCSPSLPCGRGLTCCEGICIDPARDPRHCGVCGTSCGTQNGTATCFDGTCRVACAEGFADCNARADDGCEVNLRADVAHCGTCGTACTLTNATPACEAGRCVVSRCSAGFESCDGLSANGCEVSVGTDARNCGRCGEACALPEATSRCTGGRCAINGCVGDARDCDGLAETGCEVNVASSAQHCGACSQPCAAGEVCVEGACRTLVLFVFGGFPSPSLPTPSNRVMQLVIGQRSFTEVLADGGAGVPEARAHHVAAWDGRGDRLLVFGGGSSALTPVDGTLWGLEVTDAGARWAPLSTTGPAPAPLVGTASGWDAARRRWYLFGGTTAASGGTPSAALSILDAETLTWSAPPVSGSTPPARAFAAAMVDPVTGRFVLHGGATTLPGPALGDTWVFEPHTSSWTQVLQSGPGPRVAHTFFDGASPPVLFGGSPDLSTAPLDVRADLWELDVAAGAWTQHQVLNGPAARRDARGLSLAGVRHLVSGSAVDGTGAEVLFNDVWALSWPARSFQQVRSNAPTGAAGLRSGFSAVSREPR
jgi:hypothetical protein